MSNRKFDLLVNSQRIVDAKESIKCMENALAEGNLSQNEADYIAWALPAQRKNLDALRYVRAHL